ncbi:VOC family protein [Neolewinella agarilytica]|uniref:Catechol 2,3-dioxygenase n=1 Tax=Neolewinella agarilytica TaxID=478744 RepID=A0A1H8YYR4_9BACT|nr:VOC family protein [Neolewinella agarilytica]SEP57345.1 Catechol 2,3-dioxygenase [Neolewinella agarilytica]
MPEINHVTLIVDQLETAAKFYEEEVGLEAVPAFVFDYPTAFFKFPNGQQLHLSEWEDEQSFRGHLCITVDNFNEVFYRMKELGIIDIKPWGKVRQLQKGVMQLFVRDPSGNLVEFVSRPEDADSIDPAIFEDELYQEGLYVSGRNDFRGYKAENATLYTGE